MAVLYRILIDMDIFAKINCSWDLCWIDNPVTVTASEALLVGVNLQSENDNNEINQVRKNER